MDRRKLKSKNILHKQLYSSSQTVEKTVADSTKVNNIPKSVSAVETLLTSRKRKSAEDEENKKEDPSLRMSSPMKPLNVKKKRRNESDDDDDDDENLASRLTFSAKKRGGKSGNDKFTKPQVSGKKDIGRKRLNNSDKDDNEHGGGSYIRGVLEALDRSSSSLSQSSTTSVEKSKKSKLRGPASKIKVDKQDRISDEIEKTEKSKDAVSTLVPKKKKNRIYDSDTSESDKDPEISITDENISPVKKTIEKGNGKSPEKTLIDKGHRTNKNKKSEKSNTNKGTSKKKNSFESSDDSASENDQEMSFSDMEVSLVKKSNEKVNKNKRKISKNSNNSFSEDNQEMSSSDTDMGVEKKNKKVNKKCKRKVFKGLADSESENNQEMPFSDMDTSPVKEKNKKTNNSLQKGQNISLKANTSPAKTYDSPHKSSRDRIFESPELSPLKSFHSPEKNFVNTRKKPVQKQTDDKFINFLSAAGITLNSGDSLHTASDYSREVIQKMKEAFVLGGIDMEEIMVCWSNYIEDEENLKKSLLEIKIETDEGVAFSSKTVSLARILLQVPQIQIQVLHSLFKKLIDAVMTSDSSDEAPWAMQMLQQFRFLETLVDPDILISLIEELLIRSPEWFQREIIVLIPDIVTDTLHRSSAEMLIKIMEKNSDLTNIILECINNLILGKDYREELREKILELLDKDFDKNTLPAITRFVLTACSTEAVALKSLKALRTIDMSPKSKEKVDECYTNQTFMVNTIKMNIQLFKEVAQAAITVVKTPAPEVVPLDIILLILLYETTAARKKIVEAALYNHTKDNYYKTKILTLFYTGYKQVAKNFQSTTLNLAINLLKSENPAHIEFGIEWLRSIFISQSDTIYKQREIMERLLHLMGSKDKTVKNALEVLIRIANDETERKYLQQQAGFLRSFLEKIDNLQFDEVAKLYHLLHGLCTHSELISNILNDDLSIIMQKQLCSSKVVTKCKGVLGAAMAIKHLAGSSETSDQAYDLLKKTLSSLNGCIRSQALFYDQLGQIIATADNIDDEFLNKITSDFVENFENDCIVETLPEGALVPKFGLNDVASEGSYYLSFGNGKAGASVPVFFKLLCVCNLRLKNNLEDINAILGCPILMPEDLDMPEPLTADYMIHCINWFREIISGFVTQEETLLREQVIKRLESLMTLQGEFVTMVAMCESRYQPPPCYFHHFPTPQFVRVDMKAGKKAGRKGKKKDKQDKSDSIVNKSVILPEWENWEIGSEMTVKNPAFFRQFDTKIIHLLDVDMSIHSSQKSSDNITVAQVCFIVKELLGMFQNQSSESFTRDLIQLLPKICAKFKKLIADLRQNDSAHEKEAVRLLLCLLNTIFSWKHFENPKYNTLLRDGLRSLASMMNESSALLRSCKDLVAEAYKYFETISDIATEISLAVAFVNMCSCLMKLSKSFNEQSKDRQAKMAHGFLCLEWSNDTQGAQYKAAIKELLKVWIENETDPLKTINSVLEWLPGEASSLDRASSRLNRLPSVTKINFHMLLKQLFTGLVKGIEISLNSVDRDPERIRIWLDVGFCLDKMANICKNNKNTIYLILFLRYTTILYQMLLTSGMQLLEANIKYQTEDVLGVIKLFQRSGRFLRDIFCSARKDKNVALLKLIPVAKSKREKFIYRVKGILTANNSIGAFWMGNLLNKDLDGEEIISETSEDITTGSEVTSNENNTVNDAGSEIFNSDSDEEVIEDDEE